MQRQYWMWVTVGCIAIIGGALWLPGDTPDQPEQPVVTTAHKANGAWGASPFGPGETDDGSPSHRRITDPLPPTLFARSGRIVDLHGLSAAEFIAQFGSRARTGDMNAAYMVFQAADLCATTSEPLPDMESATAQQESLHERAALEHICANVTPAQVAERMDFLAAAARAGNHDAQIDYYMEGPNGRALQAGIDDDSIAQWKSQSLAYLKSAAGAGDTFSLGLLSNVYDAGLLTPPDPKLSLAYAVADMLARNANPAPGALRNRYGNQLSDSEFNAGMQLGVQIASKCCHTQ